MPRAGEGLFFFDPKGTHFVDHAHSKPVPVGKAHLFANSELPTRFPDQFAPFQVGGREETGHALSASHCDAPHGHSSLGMPGDKSLGMIN
jgi:hypothetical protein